MKYEHWSKQADDIAKLYDKASEMPQSDIRNRAMLYYETQALSLGYIIRPEFRGMRPNPDDPMELPT